MSRIFKTHEFIIDLDRIRVIDFESAGYSCPRIILYGGVSIHVNFTNAEKNNKSMGRIY